MPAPGVSAEILVIDDDPSVREALFDFLTDEGFRVGIAVNGADGLALLRSGAPLPALILLDLAMPVMDGHQFLRSLQADPRLADVPVMVLSATISDGSLPADIRQLRKPIESQALLTAIRTMLHPPS